MRREPHTQQTDLTQIQVWLVNKPCFTPNNASYLHELEEPRWGPDNIIKNLSIVMELDVPGT
jgi:hypothetical protein